MKRWMYGWREGKEVTRREERIKSLIGKEKIWFRGSRGEEDGQKKALSDWPHCASVWIATHHFIIEDTHFLPSPRTHTHTHSDDYHTPYYWCTDNCLAPMGLPIHCNPSNTLNFHFKQKLNCQKTQGSILLPPLVFLFFLFPGLVFVVVVVSGLPSSRSNHLFPLLLFTAFVKFNIRIINDAFALHTHTQKAQWIWSDIGHNSIFTIVIISSLAPVPGSIKERR